MTGENAAKLWKDFLYDQDESQGNRLPSKKLKTRFLEKHQLIPLRYIAVHAWNNTNITDAHGAVMYTSYCDSYILILILKLIKYS